MYDTFFVRVLTLYKYNRKCLFIVSTLYGLLLRWVWENWQLKLAQAFRWSMAFRGFNRASQRGSHALAIYTSRQIDVMNCYFLTLVGPKITISYRDRPIVLRRGKKNRETKTAPGERSFLVRLSTIGNANLDRSVGPIARTPTESPLRNSIRHVKKHARCLT